MGLYLTKSEKERLWYCEEIISKGIKTFIEVGKALSEIRDSKLYKDTHQTFQEYCRDKWDMSRKQAYDYIAAKEVIDNLSPMGDILQLPENERQARPLVNLEPEIQIEAAKTVKEDLSSMADKLTAKNFEESAKSLKTLNEEFKKTLNENPDIDRLSALELAKRKFHEPIIEQAYRSQIDQNPDEVNSGKKKIDAHDEYKQIQGYVTLIKDVVSSIGFDSMSIMKFKAVELPDIKENLHSFYTKINLESQRVSKIRQGLNI